MSFNKILKWAGRRLKEPSTYVGLGTLAIALGKPELADALGKGGQIAAVVFGTGLAAATTSNHPSVEELVLKGR